VPEVNSQYVLVPGVASAVIVRQFYLVITMGEAPKQSWWKIELPPFLNGLPAQEGIGLVINYVPDVGRVAHARIRDRSYVPACP